MNQSQRPFSFIDDAHIKRLGDFSIVHEDKPWITAMVAEHLRPELAGEWIMSLPETLRVRVALAALNLTQLSDEQVAALESDVKAFLEER